METLTEVRERGLPELPPLYSYVSFRPTLKHLHKQRQGPKTAALRDLFHSLANKKHQKRQAQPKAHPQPKQDTDSKTTRRVFHDHSNDDVTSKPVQDLPRIDVAGHEFAKAGTKQQGTADSHLLPNISAPQNTQKNAQHLSHSTGKTSPSPQPDPQQPMTTRNRRRHGDIKTPLPYHTAITQRPSRTRSPSFRALTQFSQSPLPQWTDGKRPRSFTTLPSSKRDLKEWQNEIVKVVPTRPGFVQSLSQSANSAKTQTDRYPYKVLSWHPACHFYRSWSKVKDKEYVISPEWSSEKRLKLRPEMTSRAKTELSLPRI